MPATDDSQDVCEMRKTHETREIWEKKGRTRDNMKINYTHFAIRLFSRTIILSFIPQENPLVWCIITASTAKWFEMRDTGNLSHEAAWKIQNNPYTCVASHRRLICSRPALIKKSFDFNS